MLCHGKLANRVGSIAIKNTTMSVCAVSADDTDVGLICNVPTGYLTGDNVLNALFSPSSQPRGNGLGSDGECVGGPSSTRDPQHL